MSDEPMAPQNTPTSWRDVYQLVQDSEKRLTQTITDGFQRQSAISQDHEVRIRVLEASDQRDSASNRNANANGYSDADSVVNAEPASHAP